MSSEIKIIHDDCLKTLSKIKDNSIDSVISDPPYGYSFGGNEWDKLEIDSDWKNYNEVTNPQGAFETEKGFNKLVRNKAGKGFKEFFVPRWKECLRVLKPGGFAFIMAAPRQDVLSEQIESLKEAGFEIGYSSIYWTYAQGFGKGQKVSNKIEGIDDGVYAGFQPKPAVEIVIVVMKPLEEKTYINQYKSNGKGVTYLGDCRIPYASENDIIPQLRDGKTEINSERGMYGGQSYTESITKAKIGGNIEGRYPSNLLVEDDVLSVESKGAIASVKAGQKGFGGENGYGKYQSGGDDGKSFFSDKEDSKSASRYFDIDAWFRLNVSALPYEIRDIFPFLFVPKPSQSEKHKGMDKNSKNTHPTVKPIKLMSYLIVLGSREGDIILDPFGGSGTTALASIIENRSCIIIEQDKENYEIIKQRTDFFIKEKELKLKKESTKKSLLDFSNNGKFKG